MPSVRHPGARRDPWAGTVIEGERWFNDSKGAAAAAPCYAFAASTVRSARREDARSCRVRDDFQPCVYILASRRHGTLYVGVTSNLLLRVHQHREGLIPGFTKAYGVRSLVWYEVHATMEAAIVREKRLKGWRRAWKVELIEAQNEDWADLGIGLGLPRLAPASSKESNT